MLVLYSERVYRQIEQEFKINTCSEIGGLLIGYRIFRLFIVVGATISVSKEPLSQVSFELDGDDHSAQAEKIIRAGIVHPMIIGIWHSHLYDINRFSSQDRCSNQVMAYNLHGTLSALVTTGVANARMSLSTYYVPMNGNEQMCTTIRL